MARQTPPYQHPLPRIAIWAAIMWAIATYIGEDIAALFSGLLLALTLFVIGFER
jgi:hypothetical protein